MLHKLKLLILLPLFFVSLGAWAFPTATIVSLDTAFCIGGIAPLSIKYTGTGSFGVIYTIKYKNGSSVTYGIYNQLDVSLLNANLVNNVWTTNLSYSTDTYEVTIDKVFDDTWGMSVINGVTSWDPKTQGVVDVFGKMNVRIDQMPTPFAGSDATLCGYNYQLQGKKSVSENTCLWWSDPATVSFDDVTIEKPTIGVPSEGSYTFWFREVAGKCVAETSVTNKFNGFAQATLSGNAEVCITGQIPSTLQTIGNYPITFKYWDGTNESNPIIVNTNIYNFNIDVFGSKTITLHSVIDKNGCKTPDINSVGQAQSVDLLPKPNAGIDLVVCGDTVSLSASPSMPSGWWTGDGVFENNTSKNSQFKSNKFVKGVQIYWNEINKGCAAKDSISADFYKKPYVNAGIDQRLFLDIYTDLDATALDAESFSTGSWSSTNSSVLISSPNEFNSKVTALPLGKTILTWKVSNGVCPIDSDLVTIEVKDFTFSNGFTPNGDGINDVFEIFGLIQRPILNNELKIFDSAGRLVYSQKEYDNTWNGFDLSGKPLPTGPYYYLFTGDGIDPVKNYLIIKRE